MSEPNILAAALAMPDAEALTGLTTSQLGVLAFVWSETAAGWGAPSVAEISRHMAWRSPNAAHEHVQRLLVKGLMESRGHRGAHAAALRITAEGKAVIAELLEAAVDAQRAEVPA
jgi:DNA-binding MarR family transcriptional regulator